MALLLGCILWALGTNCGPNTFFVYLSVPSELAECCSPCWSGFLSSSYLSFFYLHPLLLFMEAGETSGLHCSCVLPLETSAPAPPRYHRTATLQHQPLCLHLHMVYSRYDHVLSIFWLLLLILCTALFQNLLAQGDHS